MTFPCPRELLPKCSVKMPLSIRGYSVFPTDIMFLLEAVIALNIAFSPFSFLAMITSLRMSFSYLTNASTDSIGFMSYFLHV